jgi:hypothetical protein
MQKALFLVLGGWLWLCAGFDAAQAQSTDNRLRATYTPEAPTIDGKLDETAWQQAQRVTTFTQRELTLGAPVSERTEVAILYDDQKLYVAVWCYDREPDKLIARELRRDFDYELDDNFMLILDTYNDQRNGFMFVTNPVGARADLQVFNNGGSTNAFWNGVWAPPLPPRAGSLNSKFLFTPSNTA